jgi:hypothetical protein
VKLTLLWDYIKAIGVIPFSFIIFFYIVKSSLDGGVSIWLTYWTNTVSNLTNFNITTDNNYGIYLFIYYEYFIAFYFSQYESLYLFMILSSYSYYLLIHDIIFLFMILSLLIHGIIFSY